VEFHDGTVRIPLRQKTDILTALQAAQDSKMEWGEFRLHRDSLDDVFVTLVSGTINEHGEIGPEKGAKPSDAGRR
jgi:hypothetical protein